MLRIEEQVDNGELTNPRLARKANESYGLLEQELTRLEVRKTMLLSTTTRAQRRVGYRELMKRVGDRWHEVVKPEQLPEMIDTFVEKVVLDAVSPRFYTLAVRWRDPEWGINESRVLPRTFPRHTVGAGRRRAPAGGVSDRYGAGADQSFPGQIAAQHPAQGGQAGDRVRGLQGLERLQERSRTYGLKNSTTPGPRGKMRYCGRDTGVVRRGNSSNFFRAGRHGR